MPMNKEVFDQYRKIVTYEIEARNLKLTGSVDIGGNIIIGGNLTVTGSFSGSNLLTDDVTVNYITGSILVSGSDFRGPTATITNITGSEISAQNVYVSGTLSGSSLLTDDVTVQYVTGSILVSGSDIRSPTATITNINVTNLTGSTISGSSILGPSAIITNIVSTNVTGSTLISGSSIYGANAIITNVTATNVTGSLVSGSDIRGATATITTIASTNIIGTNITGSTLISGSSIYGNNAIITNITGSQSSISGTAYVQNLSGSGNISGSTFQGTLVTGIAGSGSTLLVGNVYLTGSGAVSLTQTGQSIYISGSTGTGSGAGSGTGSLGPYTYIIYSGSASGGPYFAEDDKGSVVYSGSNATTVIQNTVNNLSSGGNIFIKAGDYAIPSTVAIWRDKINLLGEGRLTRFYLTSGRAANTHILSIGSGSLTNWDVQIKNLCLDGNRSAGHLGAMMGITTYGGRIWIDNVYIINVTGSGINPAWTDDIWITNSYFSNCLEGIWIDIGTRRAKVLNNEILGCDNIGFVYICNNTPAGPTHNVGSLSGEIEIRGNTIHDNYVQGIYARWGVRNSIFAENVVYSNGSHGIQLESDVGKENWMNLISNNIIFNNTGSGIFLGSNQNDLTVIGNIVYNNTSTDKSGIYIGGTNLTRIGIFDNTVFNNNYGVRINATYVDVKNNKIYETGAGASRTQLWGIIEDGSANYCNYIDNYLNNNINGAIQFVGANDIIKRNIGYTTENAGTATISAQSGSFAHGLSASVNNVTLTASGSATNLYMGALSWYPSGSAGFWIVQTGSGTVAVNWKAEV